MCCKEQDTWSPERHCGAASKCIMAAMKKLCLFALLVLTGMLGCEPDLSSGGYAGPKMTPRNTWGAGGTLPGAALAVDGDPRTAATSDNPRGSAELIIDLREPCEFESVIIDHGHNEMGFARKLAVATSMDGNTYLERYVGPDTRRVAILSLPGPVLARFVRIKVVTPGLQPWSVAEVSVR
jgi:hypothetical protein